MQRRANRDDRRRVHLADAGHRLRRRGRLALPVLIAAALASTRAASWSNAAPRRMAAAATPREIIAMPRVPHWIGFVGLVLSLLMCGALLANQLWLFILLVVLGLALVRLEIKYEQAARADRA